MPIPIPGTAFPTRFFDSTTTWTPNGVPSTNDTATLSTLGTYNMLFETSPSITDLNILAGNMSFGTFINPFTGQSWPADADRQ